MPVYFKNMAHTMPRWQCSRCWKLYTFEEFRLLPSCFVDITQKERYGKTSVCSCGARFHIDTWNLITKKDGFVVSTVHLQLSSPDNEDFLNFEYKRFETMIINDEKNVLGFQKRYDTMNEAIQGHWFVIDKLQTIIMNPDYFPSSIIRTFTDSVKAAHDQDEVKFRRDNK